NHRWGAAGHRLRHVRHASRDCESPEPAAAFRAVARAAGVAAAPPHRGGPAGPGPRPVRGVGGAMSVPFNPLSTTPGKQPLPLSLMALAAVLDAHGERWTLVDGNVTKDPAAEIIARLADVHPSRTPILGVTVMPGPQVANAVKACRRVKLA